MPSVPERATIRPRRSTTCTSRPPPSSDPRSVTRSGLDAASRATSAARARSEESSELSSWRESSAGTASASSTTAATIATAAARITRARRPRGLTPGAPSRGVEPEADAAHGVDQRRVPELAPQVGDVAVDDVCARLDVAPHLLERELARDDAARVAQHQLQQLGLAAGEVDPAPAAADGAGLGVEHEVGERELLARRMVAAHQRA